MNADFEALMGMLPFLIPVLILEFVLMLVALLDVIKREKVTGNNKVVWILVIVLIQIIGPVVYFLFGRKESNVDGD